MRKLVLAGALPVLLTACGEAPYDPRGVDHAETLLSVSAVGEAETRPDEARFQAGVNNWAGTAKEASARTNADIAKIVETLEKQGIAEKDVQTRTIGVQRIDYGDRKGQYQASNIVAVTVRDIEKTAAVVSAVTDVGANIVSGPDFRMSDPEKAANSAYGNAYKAARARAQAYADAAGMKIGRVLTIRDAGGAQGNRYLLGAVPVAPPPPPPVSARYAPQISMDTPAPEESGRVMAGQTTSAVSVQVDFALVAK